MYYPSSPFLVIIFSYPTSPIAWNYEAKERVSEKKPNLQQFSTKFRDRVFCLASPSSPPYLPLSIYVIQNGHCCISFSIHSLRADARSPTKRATPGPPSTSRDPSTKCNKCYPLHSTPCPHPHAQLLMKTRFVYAAARQSLFARLLRFFFVLNIIRVKSKPHFLRLFRTECMGDF